MKMMKKLALDTVIFVSFSTALFLNKNQNRAQASAISSKTEKNNNKINLKRNDENIVITTLSIVSSMICLITKVIMAQLTKIICYKKLVTMIRILVVITPV